MAVRTFNNPIATNPSKARLYTGWTLTGLVSLFLVMDGVMKLAKPQPVLEATLKLGYPASSITGIGIALLVCTALYLYRRTSVLGAVLLTGYLGGAVASNVRVQSPVFNIEFPIICAALAWIGLFLREPKAQEWLL